MTDSSRKEIVNKIVESKGYDKEVKKKYHSFYLKRMLSFLIVPAFYLTFFSLIHHYCKPVTFSGWLYGFIFIDVILTCFMISLITGHTFKYSDNRDCITLPGLLMKLVCLLETMVPVISFTYYVYYDVSTDSLTKPLWKVVIYAPIVFGVVALISAFLSMPGVYSKDRLSMSKLDWINLRREQEIAGLDPDKIPVILSPGQIKEMSISDWYQLGIDLEIAGYDVFKK